jgi:signal transduction histidine kinase
VHADAVLNSMQERVSNHSVQEAGLPEQELVDSLTWLISLRWTAGAAVLVGVFASSAAMLRVPSLDLYLLGVGLLTYNLAAWWALRWLNAHPTPITTYQWFARIQIGVDWVATVLLAHYTGGIASPALFFFLFHIIIAALLLPHDRGFLYVTLAPILVGGLALLEHLGLVGRYPLYQGTLFGSIAYDLYDDLAYVGGVFVFFAAACYITAYLSMAVSRRLRRREDQLAALYRNLQVTTSTLDLGEVLDRLAEATSVALRCKGASIRLLDRSGSRLEVAGSFGMSESYRNRPSIEVARAMLDQETLAGDPILVPDVAQDSRLQDQARFAAEGIRSILAAPLIGKTGPIGVLRAYGDPADHFEEGDLAFLTALASQGAVAIENARAYQVLEELDHSKTQFVRIVIHELRSPVTVATSLLKLLDQGYVGDLNEEQADLIDRARRRIEFLQTLIDDLLDLAAGRAELSGRAERGFVSLSSVSEQVRARFEAPARQKGLVLRFKEPQDTLVVWGNKDELDRLLNNLLSNAIKYTQKGEVCLSLERIDGSARITVSDTGIGIPKDEQAHLFEEFYRAENAKKVERSGTGLGLAIVKDLVERYGGQISVESAEGEGTTFRLVLPLTEAPPARQVDLPPVLGHAGAM